MYLALKNNSLNRERSILQSKGKLNSTMGNVLFSLNKYIKK